jgi:hypothetical protein
LDFLKSLKFNHGTFVPRSRISTHQKPAKMKIRPKESIRKKMITGIGWVMWWSRYFSNTLLCDDRGISSILQGKMWLVSPTAREELNIKKLGKALSQRTQEEIMQISMIRENMMKLCGMSNNEETQ